MKKIVFFLLCLCSFLSAAYSQTTLQSESFENSISAFTVTTGSASYRNGNSAASDAPANSPLFTLGSYGFAATNTTVAITSNGINTSAYTKVQLSFRLAAFSVGTTTNGMDAADYVQVEVSPDGGATFYNTLQVTGSGSTTGSYWSYAGGAATASTAYDGNGTASVFSPASTGSRTSDGYSTVTISSLPAVSNLKIRITLLNNSSNERWVIDDYKLTGCNTTYGIPFSEGFENSGSIPGCWSSNTVTNNSTPPAITFVTSSTNSTVSAAAQGSYFAKFNSYNTGIGAQSRLVSPAISTAGYSSLQLSFQWYWDAAGATYNDNIQVQYSLDGVNWNSIGNAIARYNYTAGWVTQYADMPADVVGQSTVYIGFLFTSALGYNCYLDDIKLDAPAPKITITQDHPAAANIYKGGTNNIIAMLQLDALNYNITPSNISFVTAGTYAAGDLTNFKLYQNTSNDLSGSPTLVQTITSPGGSGTTITFNSSNFTAVAPGSSNFLILTADVASTAVSARTLNITTTAFSNLSFTSPGGTVTKMGTSPVPASNVQTIQTASVTISAAHPATGNININTTNNIIAGFQLAATGDITPSSITFTMGNPSNYSSPSDLINFTLWQNNSNSIAGATQVGTIVNVTAGSNIVFNTGFGTITSGSAAYLLLTVDVPSGANSNKKITIGSTSFTNMTFTANGTVTESGTNPVAAGNTQTINAASRYWSGTGNWDGTTNKWGTNSGVYNTSAWLANGNANFEGTAGAVTFTAPIAGQQLNFNTSGYSFTTGSTANYLTLSVPSVIKVTSGTATFGANGGNPIFAGSNGMVKAGAGELIVRSRFGYAGSSTFAGSISINDGTLTFGDKSYASSYPRFFPNNNAILLNDATLALAESSTYNSFSQTYQYGGQTYGNAGLGYLPSFTSTGNSTIVLYNSATSTNPLAAEMLTSSSSTRISTTNGTPLNINGQLTIDYGGNISTPASYVAFGSTTFTGPVTIQLKGDGNADLVNNTGIVTNLNLGGIGTYINGAMTSCGTINDNGYPLTIYGGGTTTADGGFVALNTTGNFTGDWTIGKADGTEAAYLASNYIDAMTSGTITVNDNSMFTYAINNTLTKGSFTLTHAPKTIILYGRGPVSYPTSFDFYNFAKGAHTVIFPSTTKFVIRGSSVTDMTTFGVQYPGTNTTANTQEALQLNGPLTGNGGLDKFGVGILILNAQNAAGLVNTYQDTTRVRQGSITVLAGSNLGTGPVVMGQTTGLSTALNLNNSTQSAAFLATVWNDVTGTHSQVVNLNGTNLTLTGNRNTTYGDGAVSTLTGIISGTGNIIKDGTGIFTLTGQNTYSGLTQIKNGAVRLYCTSGSTLLPTNSVHIVGGTLRVSTSQTLKDVTLSTGTLLVDNGVTLTITGTLTVVNGTIDLGSTGQISYQAGAKLIYAGSSAQTTTDDEWPSVNPPTNITFNNYAGVSLTSSSYNQLSSGGTATVNGWLDFNGRYISGAGNFTLNGLTSVASITGNTASSSATITNVSSTTNLAIGMLVTGTNIPAGSYIIYINPLVPNSIMLNNTATGTATGVALTMNIRGGLKVSMPHGIGDGTTGSSGAHVQVTGTKIYNSGASYVFNTPTSGTTISPAFPTVGTLNYSPAWDVTISAGVGNKVIMNSTAGSSNLVISDNLTLTTGIWVTNNNLITWANSGGTITAPNTPWVANSTGFNDSYICTCNASGVEITPTGSNGFRINNVGSGTNVYFPVGTDFVSSNRMMINNSGTTDNFTVVVGKGDIGLGIATLPRVNRIWYVSEGSAGSSTVTMRLFFTKRNWSTSVFGVGQDEVENGFLYSDPHLVQRISSGQFYNTAAGSDVVNFSSIATYPYNTELYGLYTRGVSTDLGGGTNGITTFYRFSILNTGGIILPVTIINFNAYQKGSGVEIVWQALNETNVDHYEVEKSIDGNNFSLLGKVNAINNGNTTSYTKLDPNPVNGDNFYRIKSVDKNGAISYTRIAVVNIGNNKSSVSIQPNPVQNRIVNVAFNNVDKGKYRFMLYSSGGQLVLDKSIDNPGAVYVQKLTLPPNVASGVYIVKLFSNKTNFTTRLIVE